MVLNYKKKVNERIEKLLDNISPHFTIDNISKSPARFNLKKLEWFNQQYIQKLSLSEFVARACFSKFKKIPTSNLINDSNKIIYLFDSKKNTIATLSATLHEWNQICDQLKEASFYSLGWLYSVQDVEIPDRIEYIIVNFDELSLLQKSIFNEILNKWKIDFVNIFIFFNQQERLNYFILREICISLNWKLEKPDFKTIQTYFSYFLDKTRAIKLVDLNKDSLSITKYKKPTSEMVKWKKDDILTSFKNLDQIARKFFGNKDFWNMFLDEIATFLSTYPQFKPLKECENADLQEKFEFAMNFVYENDCFEKYSEFAINYWEEAVKSYLKENNLDFGSFLWPIRICLCGMEKSPSAFEIAVILGPKGVFERISDVLTKNLYS